MERKNKETKLSPSSCTVGSIKLENTSPPWIDLPRDLTANIFSRLSTIERLEGVWKVCSTWRDVCRDYPNMWRVIHLSKSDARHRKRPDDLRNMCRNALDCSQGQLVDITMDGFCNDALLLYIANRCKCSQLQRLRIIYTSERIVYTTGVSSEVLVKVLKKFLMLNELYLFSHWTFNCEYFDIEAIGRSCPVLNSFTYIYRVGGATLSPDDRDALKVAKFMPGLCHLSLLGNTITGEGLVTILDGCQQLESLDIRLNINATYDLSKDTVERCNRQLRQVWLPTDSCLDHEFYDRFRDFDLCLDVLFDLNF